MFIQNYTLIASVAAPEAPFIELLAVESTNNYAIGRIHAGMAQHGTAVFAHDQTAGKGQRGKQWQSAAGQNIALSIIWQPQLALRQAFLLSMTVATGVLEFLNYYIAGDLSVKWPNDIYWRDRKAAGILIENVVQGAEWKWAVIGVGVNVAQTHFPDMARKAVSIRQITGRQDLVPVMLAKELCSYLYAACKRVIDHPDAVIREYNAALFRLNQPQRFRQENRIFEAKVRKVTPEGRLVLEHGFEESFAVGEIEWVLE